MTNNKQQTAVDKDFVPYQPSVDMKELGFDERCFGYYYHENSFTKCRPQIYYSDTFTECNRNEEIPLDSCNAPLYQQAFRWFRKKYNIDAWVQPFIMEKSNGVFFLPNESYSYFIFKDGVFVDDGVNFLEPEKAELTCLIKLIKVVNEQQ
jgi:hypothetical protein